MFLEFEGRQNITGSSGDVKYHMGFSSKLHGGKGDMHLALAFNPSHLEIVGPVVEGSVRARQDRRGDVKRNTVLPIIIHGDAAFAGQGVVMETFNFSQAHGLKPAAPCISSLIIKSVSPLPRRMTPVPHSFVAMSPK